MALIGTILNYNNLITTFIFDMNGVITDDEELHEIATKEVFKTIGFDLTAALYRKYCLGRTDVASFKDILEEYEIKHEDMAALISSKSLKYQELIKGNLKVYPGIVELIKKLHKEYTLALTSSSTFDEVETVVNLLKIKKLFKVIVTSKDVKHGKPHPEPYLLTAKKLAVNPEECVVLEDSENGVLSAKAASMICVAITNTENEDKLTKANYIINNLDALKNILDEI